MTVPAEFAEMAQHVFALERRTVLYIEKMQLFRVTISEVKSREDGQGFEALATVIPTHGLGSRRKGWAFGAGWGYFHATPNVVQSTYGGWRIHTSRVVMDELAEILKCLPEDCTYLSDYHWEPVEGNNLAKAVGAPGPVASQVLTFLRNH